MTGDLHIHTRYSDGSYQIKDALLEARRRDLDYISFVDHDTVLQTKPALAVSVELGDQSPLVIPGIEISAYDYERKRKVHILGYGYDLEACSIKQLCTPLIHRRHENTLDQIEAVRQAGYPVTEEEVRAVAAGDGNAGGWLYKQHIMLVLISKGKADSVYGTLYKQLFKAGGLCPWDIEYVDARDAVRAVKESGGLPVLAHPGQTESWDVIPSLVDAGLSGIELYHCDHGKLDYQRVREASTAHNLFTTGGSDDHGDWGSLHRMGEFRAPFGTLAEMRRRGAARLR